jgi:hypothetical protein
MYAFLIKPLKAADQVVTDIGTKQQHLNTVNKSHIPRHWFTAKPVCLQ